MSKGMKLLIGCAVAATTVITACADMGRSLAPSSAKANVQSSDLLGGLQGGLTSLLVAPVSRNTPLASVVTWTFTAGSDGAVSSNSTVGLTISIPSGALSSTQQITVTALAGAHVAYRFEPHLVFSKRVTLTQNLVGTSAGGLVSLPLVRGAHFNGETLQLDGRGLALVAEIVAAPGNHLTRKANFKVGHFSGWLLASGASEEGEDQ